MVGERHPCARDHVGGGGAEVSAAHHHRRQATAIHPVRRHRCLQCADDGTETGPCTLRRPEATGRNTPPTPRLHPQRTRRALHAGDALPASPAARYLQPLPEARQGNTGMARAVGRIKEGSSQHSDRTKGSSSRFRKGKSPLCHQISGVIGLSRFRFWAGYTTSTEKWPERFKRQAVILEAIAFRIPLCYWST